jgi:hypothetical protein
VTNQVYLKKIARLGDFFLKVLHISKKTVILQPIFNFRTEAAMGYNRRKLP